MQDGGDDDLMRRAGLGDRAAFSRLVARHLARATGVAGRITGNRSDAEEVVQEAFLRAWLKAPDWEAQAERSADAGAPAAGPPAAGPSSAEPAGKTGASFATWFYRVLVNLCIDRKRKPVTAPIEAADDVADPAPGGFEVTAEAETRRKVATAVEALPERQRAALVLCHFEGVSNIDAAAILEITIGALESLLVRARRTLKDALQELAPDRPAFKGRAPKGLAP